MNITYDKEANALYIKFQNGKFVRNKEVSDGIILDIGQKGAILGLEILDARNRLKSKTVPYFNFQVPMESFAV